MWNAFSIQSSSERTENEKKEESIEHRVKHISKAEVVDEIGQLIPLHQVSDNNL